jgi:hypothetical protein
MAWDRLPETIGAVAALGPAAMGLVDVTKGIWLNVGNTGFGFIKDALKPFSSAMDKATATDSNELMWSHWINGREKADQKSIAKALIRMGMDGTTAPTIATAVNVDGAALAAVVSKLINTQPLTPSEMDLLGRLDAAIEARLDAAFERADRRYRSVARNVAAFYAVILSVIAAKMLSAENGGVFGPGDVVLAIIVGLVAVPLAPISKDLVTGLRAAMTAYKAAKG